MQFNFEYRVDICNWTLTILDIFLMALLGVCVKKPLNLFSLGTVLLVELDSDLILVAPGFWLYVSRGQAAWCCSQGLGAVLSWWWAASWLPVSRCRSKLAMNLVSPQDSVLETFSYTSVGSLHEPFWVWVCCVPASPSNEFQFLDHLMALLLDF